MCMLSILLVAPSVLSASKTLKVWIGYPECMPVYKAAAQDYMKEHPGGVKIEVSAFDLRDLENK